MKDNCLINRKRLRSQMALYGVSQPELAVILSINKSTLSRKMNGLDFTESEINILKKKFGNSIFYGDIGSQERN